MDDGTVARPSATSFFYVTNDRRPSLGHRVPSGLSAIVERRSGATTQRSFNITRLALLPRRDPAGAARRADALAQLNDALPPTREQYLDAKRSAFAVFSVSRAAQSASLRPSSSYELHCRASVAEQSCGTPHRGGGRATFRCSKPQPFAFRLEKAQTSSSGQGTRLRVESDRSRYAVASSKH